MRIFDWSSHSLTGTPLSFDARDRDEWEKRLHPDVIRFGVPKASSRVFIGASFPEMVPDHTEAHMLECHAMILDVDDTCQRTLVELREAFGDVLFVAYNSWSVSEADPLRWRVVLPLAKPISPTFYRSLWEWVNTTVFSGELPSASKNPGRLGYFGTLQDEEALPLYTWHFNEGTLFDATPLIERGIVAARAPTKLSLQISEKREKQPGWPSREEWLRRAKVYFAPRAEGVGEGERYGTLFPIACLLWWEWAAASYGDDGAKMVFEVLEHVNSCFAVPKDDPDDIVEPVVKAHDRVFNVQGQQEVYGKRLEPVQVTKATLEAFKVGVANRFKSAKAQDQRSRLSTVLDITKNVLQGKKACTEVSDQIYLTDFLKELATEFPDADPDLVYGAIRPSFAALRSAFDTLVPTEFSSDEAVLARLRLFQTAAQRAREAKQKEREAAKKSLMQAAFGSDRDTPYTELEYRYFEEQHGISQRTWILEKKSDYYVFVGGAYRGPLSREELLNSVTRLLAPAESRVKLHETMKDGKIKTRPLEAIMAEYGTLVSTVEWDYNTTESRYVAGEPDANGITQGGKLVLPAGKRSNLVPKYSPEVDTWLRLLAGEKYLLLEKYLAAFPNLEYPLVCLYLYGPTGTGKSAFAKGLAKIFDYGGFININEYLTKFNGLAQKTPLIVCDEHINEQVKRYGKVTALFRDMVQSTEHRLEMKYVDTTRLKGAIRVMICANNQNVLTDDREQLVRNDILATANRFLSIETPVEAAKYIQDVLTVERFRQLLEGEFAQHVLYLSKTVTIDWSQRFVVQDTDDAAVRQAIATGRDEVSAVFSLVYAALGQLLTQKGISGGSLRDVIAVRRDGSILVRHQLLKHWDTLMASIRRPKELERGPRAFSLICTDKRVSLQRGQVKFRELDMDQFKAWVDTQYLDWEEVESMLVRLAQMSSAADMAEDDTTMTEVGEA